MAEYNPFPQMIPQRVDKILETLAQNRWRAPQTVDVWGGPMNPKPLPLSSAKQQTLAPVKPGDRFGPILKDLRVDPQAWTQRWFHVVFPPAKPTEKGMRFFHWDCRGEHTVYYQDTPWSGLDLAHTYCRLPDEGGEFWIDCAAYQTSMEARGKKPDAYGMLFENAWIACRNQAVWDVYWDLATLTLLLKQLLKEIGWKTWIAGRRPPIAKCDPFLRRLLGELDIACDAYEGEGGLAALSDCLAAIYRRFPAENWALEATYVGHSHLDLVWNWPENEGRRKGIHTAATMLRLLEEYPEFIFMWTQPALYQAIERMEPRLSEQIAARIKEGRWEATGGMWVEADNNIPCGEALARSFYSGQQAFKRLKGTYSTVLWLVDVFGYSACLPKVMSLSGIVGFVTQKAAWSDTNTFPYESFIWRSPGGGEVMARQFAVDNLVDNLTGEDPLGIEEARNYRQADVHPEFILYNGVGDGGGGTLVDACEMMRRMRNLAKVPRTSWGRAEDFFERMKAVRDRLPVYEGEIYLECHRGVYTTQSEFKRLYRRAERGAQALEAVRTLTGKGKPDTEAWERLCFAQFHDLLPGTSSHLVYSEMTPEVKRLGDVAFQHAVEELSDPHGEPVVFNQLAIPRRVVVDLTASAEGAAQHQLTGQLLAMYELPGLGTKALADSMTLDPAVWKVSPRCLDNGVLCATFDDVGQITRLKVDGVDVLEAPAGFVLYPDNPTRHKAWDIERYSFSLGKAATDKLALEVVEAGPVRACLRGTSAIGEKSELTVSYILEADSPWLRIEVAISWQEKHTLLKYHFPTPFKSGRAVFGGPFGSVARPQVPGDVSGEAMWEVPANRWATIGDDHEGLALITEAKYGFSCRSGNMGLSLLRSPDSPDPFADIGSHVIQFAVGRHSAFSSPERPSAAHAAETLFAEPLLYRGSVREAPFVLEAFGSLVPAWILPNPEGEGYLIRAHETVGVRGEATLRFVQSPNAVSLVDLLGRTLRTLDLDDRVTQVSYGPYDILSILVT